MQIHHLYSLINLLELSSSNPRVSKMKNKASTFLKEMFSAIVAVVKAKSMAVKSKTSAMKNRLIIFGLLRNKRVLMSAISRKIHALIAQEKDGENGTGSAEEYNKALVLYNTAKNEAPPNNTRTEALELMGDEDEEEDGDGDGDDSYPDLRHSLFDLEDEEDDDGLDNGTGSVIDIVRNSKEDASNFRLEDEIDNVADLFIKRFHKQMKMQKLESFKRYREMLERGL